uniref:Uncharacterized protein n=1 Tax=Globodera rostochiensis TaxID=31243 RepID=A0A914GSQ9_GLORO
MPTKRTTKSSSWSGRRTIAVELISARSDALQHLNVHEEWKAGVLEVRHARKSFLFQAFLDVSALFEVVPVSMYFRLSFENVKNVNVLLAPAKRNGSIDLARVCGQIVRVLTSEKKTTLLLSCSSGAIFVVTEFRQIKQDFAKLFVVGNVLSIGPMKAQRFNVNRFDGQTHYNTPFVFELLVTANTKIEKLPCDAKNVVSFEQMVSGGLYKVKCVLTMHFSLFGKSTFATVVGDNKGAQADLFIEGQSLAEKFGKLEKNDQIELISCYTRIEDECLQIHSLAENVLLSNCKVVLNNVLVTPIKRKNSESLNVSQKTPKKSDKVKRRDIEQMAALPAVACASVADAYATRCSFAAGAQRCPIGVGAQRKKERERVREKRQEKE